MSKKPGHTLKTLLKAQLNNGLLEEILERRLDQSQVQGDFIGIGTVPPFGQLYLVSRFGGSAEIICFQTGRALMPNARVARVSKIESQSKSYKRSHTEDEEHVGKNQTDDEEHDNENQTEDDRAGEENERAPENAESRKGAQGRLKSVGCRFL